MEKEEKKQSLMRAQKVDFLIQWGKQKRLRCVKHSSLNKSDGEVKRKTTSRIDHPVVKSEKDAPFLPPTRLLIRNGESATVRKSESSSPEKEDRHYTTGGSGLEESRGRASATEGVDDKAFVWPKFYISLSSKVKEEECKLPPEGQT